MNERHVIIDTVDPVVFYGVNNSNILLIRNLFPKLRMAARGSVITVIGDEAETARFEEKIKELEQYCARYNKLTEDVILDTIKGLPPKELKMDDVIIYGVNGKPIKGRTPNQQLLVKKFSENRQSMAEYGMECSETRRNRQKEPDYVSSFSFGARPWRR